MTDDRKRRLLRHGALLFLLGLVTGLVTQQMRNPRMGLAAHLEGLMNGTFLIAVGAVWNELRLGAKALTVAFRTLLFGAYANWAFTLLAAILGTAAMTPLASAGYSSGKWQEALVGAGFVAVAVTMLAAVVLLVIGFGRHERA